MEFPLFEEVDEVVRSMAPDGLGTLQTRRHRRGIKVWFGPAAPVKEHYEAQFIPRRHVDGADGAVFEVGFHSEHRDEVTNEKTLAALLTERKTWQKELGPQAEHGPFLGNSSWRRISEVWFDADPDDPALGFEIASRLVDYLDLLEPILRSR
ncbi:MAG: hypothetical protein ACJAXA_000389 [Candidatus Aldehydirespiratoraceae bacterium]|jgi:hypothetical protein